MLNFCTLFDSNYLPRGLAMYRSLEATCKDFHLYIFAFDQKCFEIVNRLALPRATVISLAEFEDAELLRVKPTRSRVEYCWTSTSSTILYAIKKYNLPMCTYLDADLYFFADPKILIDEMGDKSILITEHRYGPEGDGSLAYGKYCVQFVAFKNNSEGLAALNWWRERCMEWCYNRLEDGKFGDQKYLDDWPTRFAGVHELAHLGGGVAFWNLSRYDFLKKDGRLSVSDKITGQEFPLVFYHFHKTKLYKIFGRIIARGYPVRYKATPIKRDLYDVYAGAIKNALAEIQKIEPDFSLGFNGNKQLASRLLKELVPASIILKIYDYKYGKKNQS